MLPGCTPDRPEIGGRAYSARSEAAVQSRQHNNSCGGFVVRCLFAHKWIMKASDLRSPIPYRTCADCGTIQRGIYDPFWRDIEWETIRERAFDMQASSDNAAEPADPWETSMEPARISPEQIQFVRKPSSRLEQWTHSLRLRRTRATDRAE